VNDFIPATVIHLDLADGPSAQSWNCEDRPVYVVFWWRGIPLGHRHIRRSRLPIPLTELWNLAIQTITRTVAAHVMEQGSDGPLPGSAANASDVDPPALEALLAMEKPLQILAEERPRQSDVTLSVIVCTRDRPESLDRCLRSLLSCSCRAEEILVVDNCPRSPATRRLVEQYVQVRYVLEPRQGLDVARNTGIRQSRGQIVAFADDDVEVHPEWIARMTECFSDSNVMAATGLVLAAELETEAQWLFEQCWGFNRGYRVFTYDRQYFDKFKGWGVPTWLIGAGANMAFRREAFSEVGYFDERLDVGAAGCSGDSELWYRLLASGFSCRYEPKAVALHYHRREMADLKNQLYYYMRGHTAALLIQFEKHRHWGNLLRFFVLLPLYYVKIVAKGLRGGFEARHRFLPAEWAGCVSGVLFFLRNRFRFRKG